MTHRLVLPNLCKYDNMTKKTSATKRSISLPYLRLLTKRNEYPNRPVGSKLILSIVKTKIFCISGPCTLTLPQESNPSLWERFTVMQFSTYQDAVKSTTTSLAPAFAISDWKWPSFSITITLSDAAILTEEKLLWLSRTKTDFEVYRWARLI